MESAVDCGDEEMQIVEAPESNVTLNDGERMELIAVTTQINKVLTPPPTMSISRHLCLHGLGMRCLDMQNVASRLA